MKPNFALNLSVDGISLLHRTHRGWHQVGEVHLAEPGLGEALNFLRKTATGLDPSGLTTKLILPASQVLYAACDAPPEVSAERRTVEAVLDGMTPYPVAELAYDWRRRGNRLQIAAVARETLTEAENFVSEHRFNPVSFVAAPDSADIFDGEPFLGETRIAATLTGAPGRVEPDDVPVRVVVFPAARPAIMAGEPRPEISKTPATGGDSGAGPQTGPKTEPAATAKPDSTALDDTGVKAGAATEPDIGITAAEFDPGGNQTGPGPAASPPPEPDPGPEATEQKSGVTQRAVGVTSAVAPDLPLPAAVPPAPPPHAHSPAANTPSADPGSIPAEHHPAVPGFIPSAAEYFPPATGDGLVHPIDAGATDRRETRTGAESDMAGLTVVGARKSRLQSKPAYIGLMLTLALVVSLALAALLSEIFLPYGVSDLFAPQQQDLSPAAPQTEENTPGTALSAPALVNPDQQTLAGAPGFQLPATPAPRPEITPEDAEDIFASTGLWVLPPQAPRAPQSLRGSAPYIASIDPSLPSFDALALPPVEAAPGRGVLAEQHNPAPAGTVFALNDSGFVIPTGAGAVSADGVTVFAGPPTATTGPRPAGARVAETPQTEITDYSGYLPRMRPADLKERHERSRFGGLTRRELAALRPALRPASPQTATDIDETPTEFAVAVSLLPPTRPDGFAEIVSAARARAEIQNDENPDTGNAPATTAVASAPAINAAPVIPTRASVARQATIPNAINLRRVSLIGVYGTTSERRALIRLRSGRYVKVEVGDRVDGGRVAAIGDSFLQYVKGGRNVTLQVPGN